MIYSPLYVYFPGLNLEAIHTMTAFSCYAILFREKTEFSCFYGCTLEKFAKFFPV